MNGVPAGEATPIIAAPSKRPSGFSDLVRKPSFLAVWLIPFTVFAITTVLYEYVYFSLPQLCVILTFITLLASVGMMASPAARRKIPAAPLVGMANIPALALGVLIGLYLYDSYAIFPKFYENTRKYTNVVPSQPAGAVGDAGKIVFISEAVVDSSQSVGYTTESGTVYCAAPVRDGTGIERIEFWAVGMGCCGKKSDFYCDSAGKSSAKGGIVVFDNNGYFEESRLDHYEKARKKAEAEFSLQSVASPLYVRWVEETNLNKVSDSYKSKALALYVVFTVVYFFAASFFASVLISSIKI